MTSFSRAMKTSNSSGFGKASIPSWMLLAGILISGQAVLVMSTSEHDQYDKDDYKLTAPQIQKLEQLSAQWTDRQNYPKLYLESYKRWRSMLDKELEKKSANYDYKSAIKMLSRKLVSSVKKLRKYLEAAKATKTHDQSKPSKEISDLFSMSTEGVVALTAAGVDDLKAQELYGRLLGEYIQSCCEACSEDVDGYGLMKWEINRVIEKTLNLISTTMENIDYSKDRHIKILEEQLTLGMKFLPTSKDARSQHPGLLERIAKQTRCQ